MPATPLPYHLVNVFTSTSHAGSQAAVVLLPRGDPRSTDETYKVNVSRDFNLPATVFLEPIDESVPKYQIRWYTGEGELPLCGHGTLAASWVVFNKLHPDAQTAEFEHPVRGSLSAVLQGDERGQGCRIGFSLPITAATEDDAAKAALTAPVCAAAVGLQPADILTVATYEYGSRSAVVQIKSSVDLKGLKVNPKALGEHNAVTILTQLAGVQADGAVRINSRVFIPVIGLDEDTSTGSAHSVLTGFYLSPTGAGAASTAELIPGQVVKDATLEAHQLSPRGGGMRCQYRDGGRAWLIGQAWHTGVATLEVFD